MDNISSIYSYTVVVGKLLRSIVLMKARLPYIILAISLFLLCILIAQYFRQQPFIRGFVGDYLVIGLLYFFLRIFITANARKIAFAVFGIAILLEGLQYLQLVNLLGWQNNPLAVIIIGATFDPFDLLAYTLGMITFYFTDKQFIQRQQA